MKFDKTKILRVLIPLVAILVIAESIYLVSTLVGRNGGQPNITENPMSDKAINIALVSQSDSYTVGKPFEVKVVMSTEDEMLVDAMNLYIQYDRLAATVSDLTSLEELPQPTFAKISDKKDVIVLNYYIENNGYAFLPNNQVEVASFMVTPRVKGEITLDLSTGVEDKDSVTMIVENGTSKVIPFLANNLRIEVLE